VTSTATVRPVPRPPQIAELLQAWKAHARKHERRARENHQAAQLADASREAWREKAETIARRHAVAQAELARVRVELSDALAEHAPVTPADECPPRGTLIASCPGCRGRWGGAWSWTHRSWCPMVAAEAAEAEADGRARPPLPAPPMFTRPPTVTEAALWARVTGRAWPSTPNRPALVEVRFVSNLHRTRTLAQFTNARDARNAARAA
jgi:hypothetical protein